MLTKAPFHSWKVGFSNERVSFQPPYFPFFTQFPTAAIPIDKWKKIILKCSQHHWQQPYVVNKRQQTELWALLVFRILIANSCTRRRGIFKGLSQDGWWENFLKTSVPLSLIMTYQINLFSAGFISLDSTFKLRKKSDLRSSRGGESKGRAAHE